MFFGSTPFPREFYEAMEKMFVEKMNETIRNPEFLSKFSQVVGSGLEGKKKMDDMSREYLEKMHLPTRQDVAHILQYLQQIESRIIQVEEKMEELSSLIAAGPLPLASAQGSVSGRPIRSKPKKEQKKIRTVSSLKTASLSKVKKPGRGKK